MSLSNSDRRWIQKQIDKAIESASAVQLGGYDGVISVTDDPDTSEIPETRAIGFHHRYNGGPYV